MISFLFATAIGLLVGCSTTGTKTAGGGGGACLTDENVKSTLADLERTADASSRGKSDSKITESNCQKRVYSRGDKKLIIFRRDAWPAGKMEGLVRPNHAPPAKPEECLSQAVDTLIKLGNPGLQRVVERAQTKIQWRWADPDIGPVGSLVCGEKDTPAYYDGLATFVHELTRDITDDDCIFAASTDGFTCFALPPSLPSTKSARLNVETGDKDVSRGLASIQDTYFSTGVDTRPFTIFDELNAHVVGTEAYTALLEKKGKDAVYPPTGFRRMHSLSLFMAQAMIYVGRLQRENPSLYTQQFGRGTANRESLRQLLQRGEASYQAWRRAAKDFESNGNPVVSTETAFWNNYIETKTHLSF